MANMPFVINPSNIKVMLENTRRQKSGEKNGTTQRLIADDMSKFSSITNSYLCNMQASNCWLSSVIKSVHLENMASCSASFYCVKCVSLTWHIRLQWMALPFSGWAFMIDLFNGFQMSICCRISGEKQKIFMLFCEQRLMLFFSDLNANKLANDDIRLHHRFYNEINQPESLLIKIFILFDLLAQCMQFQIC